jgi:hypothetical protein
MTGRLLNRQIKLLEYLTSAAAIFGGQGERPSELAGIDRGLLDLDARFSHEKRMEKIASVFAATFELLGTSADELVREFAQACPPCDISRIENARQFHGFLTERDRAQLLAPPYLADVSACELACAEARLLADAQVTTDHAPADVARPAIRRHPSVVLLRTAFDIRCIFEGSNASPNRRDTALAVTWLVGGPHILELSPEVYEVLAAIDRWTSLDNLPEAEELAADLVQAGLLELRR